MKFAFPADEGYAIYSGILNLRIDKESKNFAYDLIINKSVDYGSLHDKVGSQPLSTDDNTVTENEKNDKSKFSMRSDSEGRELS